MKLPLPNNDFNSEERQLRVDVAGIAVHGPEGVTEFKRVRTRGMGSDHFWTSVLPAQDRIEECCV